MDSGQPKQPTGMGVPSPGHPALESVVRTHSEQLIKLNTRVVIAFAQVTGEMGDLRTSTMSTSAALTTLSGQVTALTDLVTRLLLARQNPRLSSDLPSFLEEFWRVFNHPAHGADAAGRLHSFRQEIRGVAEYTLEFRTLATDSGWDDTALRSAYQRGLSEEIKDLLVRDRPATLNDLSALASTKSSGSAGWSVPNGRGVPPDPPCLT